MRSVFTFEMPLCKAVAYRGIYLSWFSVGCRRNGLGTYQLLCCHCGVEILQGQDQIKIKPCFLLLKLHGCLYVLSFLLAAVLSNLKNRITVFTSSITILLSDKAVLFSRSSFLMYTNKKACNADVLIF